MFVKLARYRDIVLYRIAAQLKSEARQNYLGYLWFALEPALMTGIFFLVFGVLLESRSPEFLWFLIIGMVAWQWFETALSDGMMGIKAKLHILSQMPLPKHLFPLVHVGSATWKFLCVMGLLLAANLFFGAGFSWTWLLLPVVMLVQLSIVVGLVWLLAIAVSYSEDAAKITQAVTRLLFYLSGVFFSPEHIPANLRELFFLNPLACFLNAYRRILLQHEVPSLERLAYAALWGALFMLLGFWLCRRVDKKLMKEVNA